MGSVLSSVLITILFVPSGFAQSQMVASHPHAGSVIHRGETTLWLRFNQRIENSRCSISLQMPSGQTLVLPLRAQAASDQIESSQMTLVPGSYVLRWQIQTPEAPAIRGDVKFSVRP